MTLQTDASIGLALESTYGTGVTVARWLEFVDHSLVQQPKFVQGQGLRNGKIIPRTSRRALALVDVMGDISLEWATSGLGLLFKAMLGNSTSTLVTGAVYQQLHTPAVTDPMPSATIQAGMPPIGGGAILPQTFLGMVCDKWTIDVDFQKALITIKTSWKGKEMVTATAYAAPSYAASPGLFTFAQGALQIGVVGTAALTVPTATALATMTGAAAIANNVTKFSLSCDNATDDGAYAFNGSGKRVRQPVLGLRSITGSLTVELTDNQWRDWYIGQNPLCAALTFTSPLVVSATNLKAQIVIPNFVLEGDVPTPANGKIVTTDLKFTVLDGESAASPLYIAQTTGDTAL